MSGYLAGSDGRNIAVRDGLLIGRVAACDVVIDDSKASRRHAKVIVEAGVVEIEDLGSSNGTLLNGKPVTRRVLRSGDEVQIGAHVLTYREGALPGAAPAAVRANATSDELFGDDDELFGGSTAPAPAPGPAAAAPAAPPPPPPPVPPPAAPAAPARVVEFADEIVEVKKREQPAAKAKAKVVDAQPVQQQQRILQFQKKDGGGGVLGDDLAQMGGAMKLLIVVAVLGLGVGVAYGMIVLLR